MERQRTVCEGENVVREGESDLHHLSSVGVIKPDTFFLTNNISILASQYPVNHFTVYPLISLLHYHNLSL